MDHGSRNIWVVDGGRGGLTCVWVVGEEQGEEGFVLCVCVVWV